MNQLNGKKVLVTGGGGFIGSHLARRLIREGAKVTILTKYNSVIDNIRLVDIWSQLEVVEADLRNIDSLRQIPQIHPDIIFHLGAYNHVGDSFIHVSEALDSNTKGTANLLEAYSEYERFIYISTSEVYGSQEKIPFSEGMSPLPISPYAIGKYGGELYARMKMSHSDSAIVVIRPFNAYGPYQSPRAVIAEMILNCLTGKPIFSTEGRQTRDFNYVENLVDGFILAAQCDDAIGNIINLGSGTEISIKNLIIEIHERTGKRSPLHIGKLDYRPTEIWQMVADNVKAKKLLGWEPRVAFGEGLERTIRWYKAYLEHYLNPDSPLHSLSSHS